MIAKDYIYDLELINENDSLGKNNDFIYSINTQIILQLLSQSSTEKMLCNQIRLQGI